MRRINKTQILLYYIYNISHIIKVIEEAKITLLTF